MINSSSSTTTIFPPTSRSLRPISVLSKSRLMSAGCSYIGERPDKTAKGDDLRQGIANAGKASDEEIAAARQHINEQIADPLDFDDNIALARLDVRIQALQEERQRYEAVLGKLLSATEADNNVLATELLAELDDWRDDFDRKIAAARSEMRRLPGAAMVGARGQQGDC